MLAAADVGACRELQQLFVVRKALADIDVEVNSFHIRILSGLQPQPTGYAATVS
jgi:hypothetical protein